MTVFHDKAPTTVVASFSAPIQMYQRKHPVLPPHVVTQQQHKQTHKQQQLPREAEDERRKDALPS